MHVPLVFCITILLRSRCAGAGLTLTEEPASEVLHNALATALIDKATGAITNYHCNDGINLVREIHIHREFLTGPCDEFQVVQQNASLVDLSFVFLRRLREEGAGDGARPEAGTPK